MDSFMILPAFIFTKKCEELQTPLQIQCHTECTVMIFMRREHKEEIGIVINVK